MVEGGGFEPPKVEPADLQSAPFDHSGTPPKIKPHILLEHSASVNRNTLKRQIFFSASTHAINTNAKYTFLLFLTALFRQNISHKKIQNKNAHSFNIIIECCGPLFGAGDRSWTHDILITSEALYQLSYTGKGRNCRESTRWKQYDLKEMANLFWITVHF